MATKRTPIKESRRGSVIAFSETPADRAARIERASQSSSLERLTPGQVKVLQKAKSDK